MKYTSRLIILLTTLLTSFPWRKCSVGSLVSKQIRRSLTEIQSTKAQQPPKPNSIPNPSLCWVFPPTSIEVSNLA